VQMVKTKHITCVILFVYDNEVFACRVGVCPVRCGRPGPVFGPVVPYFLAC